MLNQPRDVYLYDTTLRDGAQRKGISYTLEDKIRITRLLDDFGISYIEGGWPGSNPKDAEYFQQVQQLTLHNAKICAFGATRRVGLQTDKDPQVLALRDSGAPVITLVGKTWTLHVTEVLRTTLDENLAMIRDTVAYFKGLGREVVFDAEHFFDGYRADADYSLAVLNAAAEAGADWLTLCDTNGGSLPSYIAKVVSVVRDRIAVPVGIHAHNDAELAVANSLAAIEAGAQMVQGTINGFGERCGNANLSSIIPNLLLKLNKDCVDRDNLAQLTDLSRTLCDIANLNPDPHQPYVGAAAFAHKGGIHVAAVERLASSYEHIPPELVGNGREIVISELSGRGNVRLRAAELGLNVSGHEKEVLDAVKEMESQGLQVEAAEGSFELLIRRKLAGYQPPFQILDLVVQSEQRGSAQLCCSLATVKLKVGEQIFHTVAESAGPVQAIDEAMRKALAEIYPQIRKIHLVDFKVRILDPEQATGAMTRVLIEAGHQEKRWSTVGCSRNIIDASSQALADSLELFLLRTQD